MGMQQILLILLSVIIVGVAVAVGMQMFATQKASAELQGVAADLQTFATQVIAYLATPTSMGGGGAAIAVGDEAVIYTWIGLGANPYTNDNSTYTALCAANQITITAGNSEASQVVILSSATTLTAPGVVVTL